MIPMDFDNLLANRDMWGFQVRLSSKKMIILNLNGNDRNQLICYSD